MLLVLGILLSFISNSSQFNMHSRLLSRLGPRLSGKVFSLSYQKRNIRIFNPNIPRKEKVQSSVIAAATPTDDNDNENDDEDVAGSNPKEAFMEALMTSLKKKDIQKLFLSENKQISHDGSKIQFLKSVTGRLIEIKAGLRLQLVYRYLTNDKTKNLEVGEVDEAIRDLLASGFKKAAITTGKETQELSLKRGAGKLRITAGSGSSSEEGSAENSFQHDRKKNVPIDSHAAFLKALKVTTDGGRPFTGMADKHRQIQKFTEILGGLVDRSDAINQRIATTVAANFAESKAQSAHSSDSADKHDKNDNSDKNEGRNEGRNGDVRNIKVTPNLSRKAPLKVVDMGSGMAYLTFSAHSHLSQKFDLETIGVEAREGLVAETNRISKTLGPEFYGLNFVKGDIGDYFGLDLPVKRVERNMRGVVAAVGGGVGGGERDEIDEMTGDNWEENVKKAEKAIKKSMTKARVEGNKMDVLIALHACDTATDDAIWCGIQGGAQIIVTAPCCHKQVRGQLDKFIANRPIGDINGMGTEGSGLTEMLQHGIYRERESEMVTDSIRALLLEWCGYTTTVFEFIGGEHTAKNVMIAAVKRSQTSVGVSTEDIVRAREVLAGIQAAQSAKREKKEKREKKKFQSVSVNEFGDVDVDSYDQKEGNNEGDEREGKEGKVKYVEKILTEEEKEEENERKAMEIADMVDTNNRVERLAEIEKEDAIARRIDTLMRTFGVKKMKLFDLVFGDENTRNKKDGDTEDEVKTEGEESRPVKQLKMRKFRKQ